MKLSRAEKSKIRQTVWDRAEGVCEACGIGLIYDSGSLAVVIWYASSSQSRAEVLVAIGQWATYAMPLYYLPF